MNTKSHSDVQTKVRNVFQQRLHPWLQCPLWQDSSTGQNVQEESWTHAQKQRSQERGKEKGSSHPLQASSSAATPLGSSQSRNAWDMCFQRQVIHSLGDGKDQAQIQIILENIHVLM